MFAWKIKKKKKKKIELNIFFFFFGRYIIDVNIEYNRQEIEEPCIFFLCAAVRLFVVWLGPATTCIDFTVAYQQQQKRSFFPFIDTQCSAFRHLAFSE